LGSGQQGGGPLDREMSGVVVDVAVAGLHAVCGELGVPAGQALLGGGGELVEGGGRGRGEVAGGGLTRVDDGDVGPSHRPRGGAPVGGGERDGGGAVVVVESGDGADVAPVPRLDPLTDRDVPGGVVGARQPVAGPVGVAADDPARLLLDRSGVRGPPFERR
jgi:hypothetical protein